MNEPTAKKTKDRINNQEEEKSSNQQGSLLPSGKGSVLASAETQASTNELQQTSCHRFDRAAELIAAQRPSSAADALAILRDDRVRMNITEQQMMLSARTLALHVERPSNR